MGYFRGFVNKWVSQGDRLGQEGLRKDTCMMVCPVLILIAYHIPLVSLITLASPSFRYSCSWQSQEVFHTDFLPQSGNAIHKPDLLLCVSKRDGSFDPALSVLDALGLLLFLSFLCLPSRNGCFCVICLVPSALARVLRLFLFPGLLL